MGEIPLYPCTDMCRVLWQPASLRHPRPFQMNATCSPTPYTLHPTPFTLHPTPYTLHHTPSTLNPPPPQADESDMRRERMQLLEQTPHGVASTATPMAPTSAEASHPQAVTTLARNRDDVAPTPSRGGHSLHSVPTTPPHGSSASDAERQPLESGGLTRSSQVVNL